MIRGTTHTIKFDCVDILDDNLDNALSNVLKIEITLTQENNEAASITRLFERDTSGKIIKHDCFIDDETKIVSTVLQPPDTLKFNDKRKAKVQLRILMLDITKQRPYILGNFIQTMSVYPTQSEDTFSELVQGYEGRWGDSNG